MSKYLLITYTLLALLIPNVVLCFTEHLSAAASICNIFLPGALILFVLSSSRTIGRNIWLVFPYIFFAAFQIVLLALYGRSIIAVDMFLNLVTTNVNEASELLGNLLPTISIIILLYVPLLIVAGVLWYRRERIEKRTVRLFRYIGLGMLLVGSVSLIFAYTDRENRYSITDDLFPVNVCYNVGVAFDRTKKTARYHETSSDYRYSPAVTHPDYTREIYIAVIGETSRADNWQLFGYERPTTPLLSARTDLYFGRNTLSESNTTHKSVPMLLSPLSARDFKDGIYETKSVISAFKEAGFRTAFLSNQRYNRSFIDFFASEADTTVFIKELGLYSDLNVPEDLRLLPALDDIIAQGARKQLIVLHTYGSHFNYRDRYIGEKGYFQPDNYTEAIRSNRQLLVNAYDNTIRVADRLLSSCIERLDSIPEAMSGLIYTSDHGEDIFDDKDSRFLHSSPLPTFFQIHVPFIVWLSPTYTTAYPENVTLLKKNMGSFISSSRSYTPTLTDMAGISSDRIDPSSSLFSDSYTSEEAVYLDDHNDCVKLKELL